MTPMQTIQAPTTIITGPNTLSPIERRHLGALERRIERGLQTFREVGSALMEVRDHRLYRETHPSFESYCQDRWQMERQRAYQLIGAVEVVNALPDGDSHLIRNEATARELVPVMRDDPDALATVWARIKEQINDSDDPRQMVTAEVVRRVKAEILPPRPTFASDLKDRIMAEAGRIHVLYVSWMATGPDRRERRTVETAIRTITQIQT